MTARRRTPPIAPPDEDPDADDVGFASPPCLMHEVDPAYFGWAAEGEGESACGKPPAGRAAGSRRGLCAGS